MSKDRSQVFRVSVLILAVIAALALFACGGSAEPESIPSVPSQTPTLIPAPTLIPTLAPELGERFARDRVAEAISMVALKYGCQVDPSDIDVAEMVEPLLWSAFIAWATTWLLTDADMRGALKSTILDWDVSPREFVGRLPGCDPK